MTIQKQTRVAVVTGASSGVGKAAAKALAAQGWRVIGLGRDAARCAAAEAELRASAAPGAQVEMLRADFSLLADTARAAREVIAGTDRIDVLLNNAGGVAHEMRMTSEGNEASFVSNHLGPFLLTQRLLPLLCATAAVSEPGTVRIIATSSIGHNNCPGIDWEDLQRTRNFSTGGAYTNAKLANILFTRELARRYASLGIVAHAMEPGVVLASNFVSHADAGMQRYMATLTDVAVTPEQAAETLVFLATATEPGQTSGGYYAQCKPAPSSAASQDAATAERLWIESEALAARAGF
ncbi:MAG: short chain dehydrogenase family protein [Hydrocarboniphaga sp.]|uniref:SDR family NAD(P)-dependent oxidoreductase n=1 Tax=Hydrocarboniphaga sp. TaxID=2033016 RepID=UPI00261678A7|nr:SDR family NAD(P)-dependent oxidoreductase [Hydrocarboniphaga sp.]MDB5972196.1 short chain dehydrogenase family protein [Hydrocarboniphaga sp.]